MKELYRLRKLLQKLRHLVGIDDTRGRAISDIEKQNIEEKITDRNEKKKIADDNEELTADDDEDLDSAPVEKETNIANQLRECCNKFGDEKQDMLQQSAGYLLELGKLYLTYAITRKNTQQKLNFVKSAALINGAIVRYQKLGLDDEMEVSKNELYKLHSEVLKLNVVNGDKDVDIHKFSGEVKTVLEAYQKDVYEKLDAIIADRKIISDEDRNKIANSDQIKEICELSTERYLNIMWIVANKCEAIMGKPPCKFSLIGLGSLARKEATLYSDFEHAILLDDDVEDDPVIKEYFRWFTTIFHIIIIGLGETPISSVNVRSLNDQYSSDKSKNWFSDSYTPRGITFDGMTLHAGKIPYDQQQATVYWTHTFELIQSARKMANLLTLEDDLKNGYSLRETLRTTCLVYGNQEVYNCFYRYSNQMLYYKQEGREIVKQQSKLLLCPSFVAQHPWFLYFIQEKLTSFISAMSAVWGFDHQSSHEIVDQMKDSNSINEETHRKLRNALDVMMEVKMKTLQNRCCQSKNQPNIGLINIIEEEMMMDCFVTVISLTVELQRQLDKASTCPKPDMLAAFCAWFMEESTTIPPLSLEVVIKEVEFALDLACRTINSFVKADPKLASSEAKLAIKTASLILTTYFDQIFFKLMDGRMEWFPNLLKLSSIGSTLENLESHCGTLLKFTDDNDRQLLLHYYPMMFLLHSIQNQFLQASKEYDRWQKLILKQKVRGMGLPSTNVSLELLHIHIMSEASDANDMMTRIQQIISSESNYQRMCFLKIGLCLAKLKMGRTKEARKELHVLVRDIRKNSTKHEKKLQQLLLKNIFDIQLTKNFLVDAAFTLHEEISSKQIPYMLDSPFLDCPRVRDSLFAKDLQQFFLEMRELFRSILKVYQHHMLHCVDSADPLECGFNIALGLSFFNHRKCANLLWKILHDPTVTKFLMQESVVWIFNILSYRCASMGNVFWIVAVQCTQLNQLIAIYHKKEASANIAEIKRREPRQAMTSSPHINSRNKEIPTISLPQDAEEKISNQEAIHPLRKSSSLPHPAVTDLHIHSSSSVNQDLVRSVVASKSRTVLIGSEGGKVEVGGCVVTFPPGSFDDVTKVYAKAEIDSSKWPPKYICITAMLWVESQKKLLKMASVSMKSWCMKNFDDPTKVHVHVLHQEIGSTTWEVVATLPLNDHKILHFDCADFSPYVLGICEDDLSKTISLVDGRVYAWKGNNFSLAFFLQHELLEKFAAEMLANTRCEYKLILNPLSVKMNDKISVHLNCLDETFRFPKEFKRNFEINKNFVEIKRQALFHSLLIGHSQVPRYVPFECEVQQNDALVDEHSFNYKWRPLQPVAIPSAPQPPPAPISIQNHEGATLTVDCSTGKGAMMTANKILTGQAQDSSTHYDENNKTAVGDKVVDATMKK